MAGFPAWFAGEIITADGLNGRNMRLVAQESDLELTSTTFVESQITWVPEPNAVYAYWLYISYSADAAADLVWRWESESTCGVLMASFTQAYVLGAAAGVNTDRKSVVQGRSGAVCRRRTRG